MSIWAVRSIAHTIQTKRPIIVDIVDFDT